MSRKRPALRQSFNFPFFQIPYGILKHNLNPYQQAVWFYLRSVANYGETVFPKQETIAENANLSLRKTKDVLKELQDMNLIKSKKRTKGGKYTSSEYIIPEITGDGEIIYDDTLLQDLQKGVAQKASHSLKKMSTSAQDALGTSAQCAYKLDSTLLTKKTSSIFEEWNKQKIIQHKKITKKMEREVDKLLKGKRDDLEEKQTEEEVIEAIRNYGHVVNSPGFYFKYKWRLDEFLRRGYLKFKDGQLAKQNYAIDKNNFEPEDNKPSLKDRTDAYTKKLLEEERANGVESEKNARSRDGNNRSDTC